MSGGRKVPAQGKDLGHLVVTNLEADGHSFERTNVMRGNLGNLSLDVQDNDVGAIGHATLDE